MRIGLAPDRGNGGGEGRARRRADESRFPDSVMRITAPRDRARCCCCVTGERHKSKDLPMRIRKNVKFLSDGETSAFFNAVLSLKTAPSVLHPGDPDRSRYDDYAEVHMNAMMPGAGWAHVRPAFFPW